MNNSLIEKLAREGVKKPLPGLFKTIAASCFFVILYMFFCLLICGIRKDFLQQVSDNYFTVESLLVFANILLAVIAINFLRLPDLNQKHKIKYLPLIFFIILSIAVFWNFLTIDNNQKELVLCESRGYVCMFFMLIFAAIPSLFLFKLLYYGSTTKPYLSAIIIGIAGGNISYLISLLSHNSNDFSHIILWHFLPNFLIIGICFLSIFFLKNNQK